MRIASALVAFVFLHAAVAVVLVRDLDGGNGDGHLKDTAEHHPSQPPPSLTWPKPSNAPSIFPMSGVPEPSAPPPGAPKYPTPSDGESHAPPPPSRRAEPTKIPNPFPASLPPSFPSGVPSQPLPPMKVDPSGKPPGSSPPSMPGYPKVNPSMKA